MNCVWLHLKIGLIVKDDNSKISFICLSFSFESIGGVLFFGVQWKSKTRPVILQEVFADSFSSAHTKAYVTTLNPLFSFIIMQE